MRLRDGEPRRRLAREGHVAHAVAVAASAACLAFGASAATVTNVCKPRVIADVSVATAAQRKEAGGRVTPPSLIDPLNGFAWPDTQLGVVKSVDGKSLLFFGSDGGCHANCAAVTDRFGSITRTVGTLNNAVGAAQPVETILAGHGLAPPIDYVGGGPVLRVPAGRLGAGNLLMVYHLERATYAPPYRYPDPLTDQTSFYSALGLASSTDDGVSWTDLGEIISANAPYTPNASGYDIGDGDLVVDPSGTYFYVYFPDRLENNSVDTFLSVARVPMAAILNAAFAGGPKPLFRKYDHGQWTEPGLGGLSTRLLPGLYPAYAGDPSIAYDTALKRYVAIFDDTQNISYAESPDGLHWSDPVRILATVPADASALYAAAVGLGDDPSQLGQQFAVYYTYFFNAGNPSHALTGWAGAQVRRLTVACPQITVPGG